MNTKKKIWIGLLIAGVMLSGCASINKTRKVAVIGASRSGAVGAIIK